MAETKDNVMSKEMEQTVRMRFIDGSSFATISEEMKIPLEKVFEFELEYVRAIRSDMANLLQSNKAISQLYSATEQDMSAVIAKYDVLLGKYQDLKIKFAELKNNTESREFVDFLDQVKATKKSREDAINKNTEQKNN